MTKRNIRNDYVLDKITYTRSEIEANWDALIRLYELFSDLALYVGTELGFKYPDETEKTVMQYCSKIRNTYR